MTIKIQLPSQLRALADNKRAHEVEAATLQDVFAALDARFPLVRSQLFEAGGAIRQFVGIFVNGRQVASVPAEPVALQPGSQVTIVMAVAGG